MMCVNLGSDEDVRPILVRQLLFVVPYVATSLFLKLISFQFCCKKIEVAATSAVLFIVFVSCQLLLDANRVFLCATAADGL